MTLWNVFVSEGLLSRFYQFAINLSTYLSMRANSWQMGFPLASSMLVRQTRFVQLMCQEAWSVPAKLVRYPARFGELCVIMPVAAGDGKRVIVVINTWRIYGDFSSKNAMCMR